MFRTGFSKSHQSYGIAVVIPVLFAVLIKKLSRGANRLELNVISAETSQGALAPGKAGTRVEKSAAISAAICLTSLVHAKQMLLGE